jgi:hypothetical protein
MVLITGMAVAVAAVAHQIPIQDVVVLVEVVMEKHLKQGTLVLLLLLILAVAVGDAVAVLLVLLVVQEL